MPNDLEPSSPRTVYRVYRGECVPAATAASTRSCAATGQTDRRPRGLLVRLRGEEPAASSDAGAAAARERRGCAPASGPAGGSPPRRVLKYLALAIVALAAALARAVPDQRRRSQSGCRIPRRPRQRSPAAATCSPRPNTVLSSGPTSGRPARDPRSPARTTATRAAARTRSCCGGSAAASRGGSRSRATRVATIPGHGPRRSTRPTRTAARRWRSRRSSSSPASRSTT